MPEINATPLIAPLKEPKPATTSFRDRLRVGAVKKVTDNQATVYLPMEVEAEHFVLRIPRSLAYAELRTKDAFKDDEGKQHKDRAMLTIATMAVSKDADYTMTFHDEANGNTLYMPCRPSATLNLNVDYGAVKVIDADGNDITPTAE